MANSDKLFKEFNSNLQIPKSKRDAIKKSDDVLRDKIRKNFKENHPGYIPRFYQQGSSKTKNRIRTKDDTCDLDDGVYFKDNPDNVSGTTLQSWVKKAVDGITDSTPSHRKKCITVDYKAGYNIDLPVFLFNADKDMHPKLAVKDAEFQEDDPKEFIEEFNKLKDAGGQLIRISRYLKGWCDHKREKMPNGLSMTVLAMKYLEKNDRDDVALKFTLIAIETALKKEFKCIMPTTPKDDLFVDYDKIRKENFLNNLADFIADAKKAVDEEKNRLKASRLWQRHLGKTYFPEGEDEDEKASSASLLTGVIGSAKPYYAGN
ncbi:MAG: hypothetical protein EP332_04545 [Bacteroidetes bacterium]|nr:MAG: hypothetical protein EP332_04545 [Bacteroidota bacterium]